jgi:hypothetical protein
MPDAVDTMIWAPDDGWRYHPKHVEQFTDICVNKLYIHDARTIEHKVLWFYLLHNIQSDKRGEDILRNRVHMNMCLILIDLFESPDLTPFDIFVWGFDEERSLDYELILDTSEV